MSDEKQPESDFWCEKHQCDKDSDVWPPRCPSCNYDRIAADFKRRLVEEIERLCAEYKSGAAGTDGYNQGLIDGQQGLYKHIMAAIKAFEVGG